jgi:hypothetical protein
MHEILPDGPSRKRMLEGLARVKARLCAPAAAQGVPQHPADRAAQIIFSLLAKR